MILERLLDHKGIAPYASVSKEWRTVIEKGNFSHLKLNSTCLGFLAQLTEEQTAQIDHIWLNVKLKSYTCGECGSDESLTWSLLNNRTVATSVASLFDILANWNWKEAELDRHLTLELNTYSPSDSEHWFKHCYFGAPGEDKFEVLAQSGKVHDPHHGWWHGRNTRPPPNGALRRPFESYSTSFYRDGQELPLVYAVTKFILRRQCRRQLDPWALSYLWSKLPRLKEICYEPWQLLQGSSNACGKWVRYERIMSLSLRASIEKVTIFEDLNEKYLDLLQRPQSPELYPAPDRVRVPTPAVGAAFAARSRQLEHLSVAFLVDARDSSTTTTARETNELLKRAALIALNMSKLEKMVLWNGSKEEACSFTYCQGDDASLVWKGTWDLMLEDEVLDAWRAVVEVEVEKQVLTDEIKSHGDAVKYLGLQSVVDKVSLQQIRAENNLVQLST
ncbi:hypothetical protein BKA59DRAFT_540890 [Fusarium tricinctum]|uniref:DUF6546 domain-containing protein n=1 Tax=Fusarium tricinctum TaxID=61284 RepID=A0A8K0WI28_9HYPO|nr:hypothetical protein BKA59DRAFT_540890 [Fusarium tricinctum]